MTKYRSAIALSYDCDSEKVPEVALHGDYFRADEIVSIARQYGVPVIEEPLLVDSLRRLDEGEHIPAKLFQAVAIILAKILSPKKLH